MLFYLLYGNEFHEIMDIETIRTYCLKKKAFYERDPKLRPFGEKMYYGEQNNVLCPVHKKWHIFGFKHKIKEPQTK